MLPYVEEFLHVLAQNVFAIKNLVQSKDLVILIARALSTAKVAEKLTKICVKSDQDS